jgi:hypothetical protein
VFLDYVGLGKALRAVAPVKSGLGAGHPRYPYNAGRTRGRDLVLDMQVGVGF